MSYTRTKSNFVPYVLLTIFMVGALLPFVGTLLTALKDTTELPRGMLALPLSWKWENFSDAWNGARFSVHFTSSVIVVVPVVTMAVLLSTMAGYAFGTMHFPGDNLILLIILLGLMMPFEAVIIPLWQLMSSLGLRNTYWALILPQVALSFSFGTFWMRGHFKNTPTDLMDAAIVDGCNQWNLLWRVLFPLARPALLSLVVLLFMWTWNEFFLVLVMVSGDLRTLPVGLALLRGRYSSDIPVMAAASLIVSLPVIIVYVFFQRSFIRGVISGALKA
jgi:raffinose/stachyose/melibiose transport system permease protein